MQQVQVPACFDYATRSNMDTDKLELVGVVIASNQFRGHVCNFRDVETGFPVQVRFSDEDIPYFADTIQVMSTVCGFLCSGMIFYALLTTLMLRLGIQPYWVARND